MSKHIFFSLFISLLSLPALSTVIEGQNKEYSDQKLAFFRYSDPVTKEKIPVFSLEIDAEGNFRHETNVSKTTFVFCDFGIYRGMLFLEPNQNIHLRLPPLRKKSFSEQKNPFFQPVEFWFTTKEGDQLNDQVAAFDEKLNQLTDKHFNQLYFRQSRHIYDTIMMNLNQQFSTIKHAAFLNHKKLKQKSVQTDAFRLKPSELPDGFSAVKQKCWTHPAFLELFEKTFSDKLSFEVKSERKSKIREAVFSANTGSLINWLKKDYQLNSPMVELVLLKILHDGFYSGDFPEKSILKIVGSETLIHNPNERISEIADNVLKKLQHLRPGSHAPVICLKNTDGQQICSDRDTSKFKYLIFADTEMIVCREHLKYLKKIKKQFSKYLEIILILHKKDLIEMKMFLNKQEIPGIHLIDENNQFIEKYRVKSFPVCFLLNKNHEVVFSHTKAPLDGFEQHFGAYLQKELFEGQRNQPQ
jgi:peroxiredoxin